MKKTATLLILLALALSGCISSKGFLQKGNYNAAIDKSVKKLIKNPEKAKEISVLTQAYKNANQKDLDRISYLKKTGEPDIWDMVFLSYSKLKIRQEKVKVLPQIVLNKIGYEYVNYDLEIIAAKKKAAEYFYVHGQSLLEKAGRANARLAYYDFKKVKDYYSIYKDVDSLIEASLVLGTANVLFEIKNETSLILPTDFESTLTKISLADLNKQWINYDTKEVDGRYYDYTILVSLKVIDVSPEALKEIHTTDTKEIADGFSYLLDAHGNVIKDSLGNDIKIPKYKTIRCEVIEIQQKKSAIITGILDYIDNTTKQLLKTDPVTTQTFFENNYATAFGDLNALSAESLKKLNSKPLPFPTDPSMILQAGEILKTMLKDIITRNKYLLV